MRRTHTPSSACFTVVSVRELPSRQGRFKPPSLAFSGNQGVVPLSASQSLRNGAVDGGGTGVKNNSPSVGSATTALLRGTPPRTTVVLLFLFQQGLATTLWWVPFVPELSGRFGRLRYAWCVSWSWPFDDAWFKLDTLRVTRGWIL